MPEITGKKVLGKGDFPGKNVGLCLDSGAWDKLYYILARFRFERRVS